MQPSPAAQQRAGHHPADSNRFAGITYRQTPGSQTPTAQLKTAAGRPVATATFEFANGYSTVTVKTIARLRLVPNAASLLSAEHVHVVTDTSSQRRGVSRPLGAPSTFAATQYLR